MITEIEFKDLMKKGDGLISSIKNIDQLEQKLLSLPQLPCPVTHRFGPGIYMREVSLPRGSLVIGHHQNFEHMNVFLRGRITFFGENGPVEMSAPMTLMANPGRKIAFVHEDSVWVNIYATDETDIEKLEAKYLTKSQFSLEDSENRKKIGLLTSKVHETDFKDFLKEFSLDEKDVRAWSENNSDRIGLPLGDYKIKTGKSPIEGTGLFATGNIIEGEIIAPARIQNKRTIAGRFANHSPFPNAQMIRGTTFIKGEMSEIDLVAIKPIRGCQGGQDGEEITIDYREAIKLNLEIGGKKCLL